MSTRQASRPLAIVTGASSGIGFELARCCAPTHDLIIAADQGPLQARASQLRAMGAHVTDLLVDLATPEGVDEVCDAAQGQEVDLLLANAGHGLGRAFLEQDFSDVLHVIDTNVTGTLKLIHRIGKSMVERGRGRILITGSIAGFTPGSFQAVYNASKAFIDSFSYALRNELKDSGVSVTCLMPGVTDTEFFKRAEMLDTKVGADPHKADAAEVARIGFAAMMRGDSDVVAGWKNKLQATLANITPAPVLAEQHRKMAEPGSALH